MKKGQHLQLLHMSHRSASYNITEEGVEVPPHIQNAKNLHEIALDKELCESLDVKKQRMY